MNNTALFILNSPFQALCAEEAITFFQIDCPVFFVLNDTGSREKILKIIERKGEIVLFNHQSEGTYFLYRDLKKFNNSYMKIFIGDYFSYTQYFIAVFFSSYKSQHIYLDDGNSTLEVFPPISRSRYESRNQRIGFVLLNALSFFKNIKTSFFTFFDIRNNKKYQIIKNDFSLFKQGCKFKRAGIYIIGTNTACITFKNGTFEDSLLEIVSYLKDLFPDEKIYYCPHRRDSNEYSGLLNSVGVEIFNTLVSVEVDFCYKRIYPNVVIGWGSTALITLKYLYPESSVISISVETTDECINNSYRQIEKYYQDCGIFIKEIK